ncbi:hypothetical protein BJV74DRAFT_820265 [Russula compacta]|nr:hypothetical protein BJV74DRAFT_820265 [Russula compacta]
MFFLYYSSCLLVFPTETVTSPSASLRCAHRERWGRHTGVAVGMPPHPRNYVVIMFGAVVATRSGSYISCVGGSTFIGIRSQSIAGFRGKPEYPVRKHP